MNAVVAVALLLAGGMYLWAARRAARLGRGLEAWRIVMWTGGLITIAVALCDALDARADASLAYHMAQHLLLIEVAAPLLLLGAPHRLALAALPQARARVLAKVLGSRALRALTHPAIAWLQFAAVLYGVHFSPLYEAALQSETVHAFEHLLFLTSALIFWQPLLAVAPAPHAPAHPLRLLAAFLALPMSAFLGFAFYASRHVFYAHYAPLPDALGDQQNAGALMWIAGAGPLFLAFLWLVADWGARERRLGALD